MQRVRARIAGFRFVCLLRLPVRRSCQLRRALLTGSFLTALGPDIDSIVTWQARVASDPSICSGKPCIKGTRIPAHIILDLPAAGEDYAGIRKAYPGITEEDIQACIGYAAMLAEVPAAVGMEGPEALRPIRVVVGRCRGSDER